jgi:hypothetical protein
LAGRGLRAAAALVFLAAAFFGADFTWARAASILAAGLDDAAAA